MSKMSVMGGQKVTDDEILRVMEQIPDPAVTTSEIAQLVPVNSNSVRYHLEKMVEESRVEKKTVGARAVVYWLAESDEGNSSAPTSESQ